MNKSAKSGYVVAGFLALTMLAVAIYLWKSLGDVQMSTAGYVAIIFGGLATLGMGVGLMVLMFYSHNEGYDDRAGADPTKDEPHRP